MYLNYVDSIKETETNVLLCNVLSLVTLLINHFHAYLHTVHPIHFSLFTLKFVKKCYTGYFIFTKMFLFYFT